MALTLRGILVLLSGVVLGTGFALGSMAWSAFGTRAHVRVPVDPAVESAALVAEVIDRVRREYVDAVDDRQIVELTVLIGTYAMHVRVFEALKLDPEQG